MSFRFYITTCILTIWGIGATAQSSNIGIPFVKNFTKRAYNAGTQNWDIVETKNGVIYFANNEGMLQFNGKTWRCYPLPNKTIVRSLGVDESGIIYAGGQNEFGYFRPDEKGDWVFHSLRNLIPEKDANFEDVWDIVISPEGVFFRTSKKLLHYHNDTISVLNATGVFNFTGLIGQKLLVQDNEAGLLFYEQGHLKLIVHDERFSRNPLTGLLPIGKNEWLATTLFGGLFRYDGQQFERWLPEENNYIVNNRIYSSAVFPDGRIALGTSLGGLLILAPDGKVLQHLNRENSLLNNNVLSMLVDQNHHLWLGLDNGINYVLANSPFSRFSPDRKAGGAGHDVQVFEDKIYFAGSNGVFFTDWKSYYSPFETDRFEEINETKGQAWGLNVIDESLLLSHHAGSFQIENGQAIRNHPGWGLWLFKKLSQKPNLLLAGTYTGLTILKKEEDKWNFRNKIGGFGESSRFVEEDENGNIWVAHPYKGIYKITLDEQYQAATVKKYGASDGLSSDLLNHVFKINKELIFCSETGIFKYESDTDRFLAYQEYNKIFGSDIGVKRLLETPSGNIWYVTDQELGILEVQEKSILKEIYRTPFPQEIREQLVNGFEQIRSVDEDNVFICTETGFIHFDPKKRTPDTPVFKVVLDEIISTSKGDSLISKGWFFENGKVLSQQPTEQKSIMAHWMNAFRFSFSSTDFTEPGAIQFQYYLEGLEEDWSGWIKKSEKEYTNLLPGNYTFHIKALNSRGKETDELTYQFKILPPWYSSKIAKVIYFLFVLGFCSLTVQFFRRKYYKQKEKVVQSEKEIGRLKNERLEVEVAHKNRELFSNVIHLQHKNATLSKIKTELSRLKKQSREEKVSQSLYRVIKMMEIEENSDSGWDQFMAHFNDIHTDFFDRLGKEFPELSPKDFKMCAYLRMNLSTKEIATLMNNTVRGVEGGRYRVRKKWDWIIGLI